MQGHIIVYSIFQVLSFAELQSMVTAVINYLVL